MLRIALTALLLTTPALAEAQQPPVEEKGDAAKPAERDQAQDRPGVDDMARDAALQPLVDTNLKKREINPLLAAAAAAPYSLDGVRRCKDVSFALMQLDDVLGPDVDAATPMTLGDKRRRSAGEAAKSLVGGLIPFRGVIREVSGAGEAQRRYHAAWEAGLIRRAFLKGYAAARKCKPRVTVIAAETAAANQDSAR